VTRKRLTVPQAAEELGVTRQRVGWLIRHDLLKAELVSPRLYLIERGELDRYKKRRRPGPGRPPRRNGARPS
jgi:hypothetical protein